MEQQLVDAAAAGEEFLVDRYCDPPWRRQVCGHMVAELCAGSLGPLHRRGVRARGLLVVGSVDLRDAELKVPLALKDCDLLDPVDLSGASARRITLSRCVAVEVNAQDLALDGPLDLSGTLFADPVVLSGADIGGQVSLSGAVLSGADSYGNALDAEAMKVRGAVFMEEGFRCENGAIRLSGADIGGVVLLSGAVLCGTNHVGHALVADGMKVGGSVFMQEGFRCENGAIRMPGADIAGQVSLSGAVLSGADRYGDALVADGMKVGGAVFLRNGFRCWTGRLSLAGAEVSSTLDLTDAEFSQPGGDAALSGATVDPRLASCGEFAAGWASPPALLKLSGFSFERIRDGLQRPHPWQDGHWIRLQPLERWSPDPYEQLAAAFVRQGAEDAARKTQIAKNNDELANLKQRLKDRTSQGWLDRAAARWRIWWRRPLGWLVGYGYRRWPAGVILGLLIVAAWAVFARAESTGELIPTNNAHAEQLIENEAAASSGNPAIEVTGCGEAYPCLSPAVYASDVVLPIVDFGQDSEWRPTSALFQRARWVFIALGWALATVFVAGFTNLVRRD